MKLIEIECDACENDLSTTGNSVDYRVVLKSESKPKDPECEFVTDMWITPDFKREHHFCNRVCLEQFLNIKK